MMRDPRTTEAVAYGVTKAILDKAEEVMTRDVKVETAPLPSPGLLERLKQRFQRKKP
jgi:hypothetical protein